MQALASVASTIEGVDAASLKRSHQLRVHQWVSENCTGFPSHKTVHMKKDKCKKLEAHSVTFHVPRHNHHSKWLNPIAAKEQECYVSLYKDSSCKDEGGYSIQYSLPHDLEKCLSHPAGIKAAKFWCVPIRSTRTRTEKTFSYQTHYTYDKAHPSPTLATTLKEANATVVEVVQIIPTTPTKHTKHEKRDHDKTKTVIAKPTSPADYHSDSDSDKDKKVARIGHFWYKDPWGGKPLCFECKGKKHKKAKFECKASSKKPAKCAPLPSERVTVTELPPYAMVDQSKASFLVRVAA